MRTIKLWALLVLLSICSLANGQTGVMVTYYDGTEQVFNVAASGKLYFASDNLQIKLSEASSSTTTIPVSIIRKINFTDTLATLSVQLNQFNLQTHNCAATINWESGVEVNFSHYELQYGPAVSAFNKTITLSAKGSNSAYSIPISGLNGNYVFRLKMVDLDGSLKYSNTLSGNINCTQLGVYTIYPNPASDIFKIKSTELSNMQVKIYSTMGQLVLQGQFQSGENINISALKPGIYVVDVNGIANLKLLKQ